MSGKVTVRREGYGYKGTRRETKNYYVCTTDHLGIARSVPAFRDYGASLGLANIIQRLDSANEANIPPDPVLTGQVAQLPQKAQRHLVKHGFMRGDTFSGSSDSGDINEAIQSWKTFLETKGASRKYSRYAPDRVARIVKECAFARITDITRARVQSWLHSLVQGGMSGGTVQSYVGSIKAFMNFLLEEGRIVKSPLQHLRFKADAIAPSTISRLRRPLANDERERLLSAARDGAVIRNMTGKDREAMYLLALETGLRWSEIRSLVVSSFSLDTMPPTVTVLAAHSKRRRTDILPLRGAVAEWFKSYLSGRNAKDHAIQGMPADKGAKLIRHDLAAAGIPFETGAGIVDFHSLRHTFITSLSRAGIHPKTAQALARHSDVNLTLNRYTHLELGELAEALENHITT